MSEQDEKKTVWYVRDGRMHSSWIIGHMDINVAVEDSESYTKPVEVAANILTTDRVDNCNEHQVAMEAVVENSRLYDLVKRPGRWFYLSGMNVVHGDDLYSTREAAAEAYKKFLLGDE